MHSLRNIFRAWPINPLASARLEHSTDSNERVRTVSFPWKGGSDSGGEDAGDDADDVAGAVSLVSKAAGETVGAAFPPH